MPIGNGADTLDTIPGAPYVSDPGLFDGLTIPNVQQVHQATHVAGQPVRFQVPQVGILAGIRATFIGSMTVDADTATCTDRWPHGLIKGATVSVNGQDKLVSVEGEDLHCLKFARNPAYEEAVDTWPGPTTAQLGTAVNIAAGTHAVHLSYELPVAMDMVTLVGSLYAQSAATVIAVEITPASLTDLFAGDAEDVTAFSGTWIFETVTFKVPRDPAGQLVTPDLSRLHGVIGYELPFTTTGDVVAPVIRAAGQLCRLFVSLRRTTTAPLSALPATAAANKIETVALQYGGNERPFKWDPAANLLRTNNAHYGSILPYNRLCIDLVRNNPRRDALILQGVTELQVAVGLNSSVTPGTGAEVRLVQETLY